MPAIRQLDSLEAVCRRSQPVDHHHGLLMAVRAPAVFVAVKRLNPAFQPSPQVLAGEPSPFRLSILGARAPSSHVLAVVLAAARKFARIYVLVIRPLPDSRGSSTLGGHGRSCCSGRLDWVHGAHRAFSMAPSRHTPSPFRRPLFYEQDHRQ